MTEAVDNRGVADVNSATTAYPGSFGSRAGRRCPLGALTLAAASSPMPVEAPRAGGLQVGSPRPLPKHLDGVPCGRAATSRDCPRPHLYAAPVVRPEALVDRPRPGTLVSYLSRGELVGPFLVTSLRGRSKDHLVLEGPRGLFEHYFDAGFNTFPG